MMKKILAVPLLSIGLSLPTVTLGSPIEPGFDLLKTGSGTEFDMPVIGIVPLEGNPALFPSGSGLNNTDTIVERKQGIDPFEPPSGIGIVSIELIALSLKSINSFDGTPLGVPGMVDLYVIVKKESRLPIDFPDLPQPCTALSSSNSSMTIQHTTAQGGTFTSRLTVDACFIFVAAGGDVNNPSDTLAFLPLSSILPDPNDRTLTVDGGAPWSHTPPPDWSPAPDFPTGGFFPGVRGIIKGWFNEIALLMKHRVILLATDVELEAKQKGNSNQVGLTLTTSGEQNTAKFIIYRGEQLGNGGTAMTKVCSRDSGGSPYSCTDNVVGDNYRVVEIEYDGNLILYDKVNP